MNKKKKRIEKYRQMTALILAAALVFFSLSDVSFAKEPSVKIEKAVEAEVGPVKESETEKETETQKETKTETESESETKTETETETELEKETESESEKETEKETESESEKETEKETETEGEKESEAETEKNEETKAEELSVNLSQIVSSVHAYVQQKDSNPDYSSIWNMITLKRSGTAVSQSYTDTFYENVFTYCAKKNWQITRAKYSDYSKLILGLTAIGVDAKNVAGKDLFVYLADYENVKAQGINGPIWALIALKSHPSYSIPKVQDANVQTTEELLIQSVLIAQRADGGWTLTGNNGDADMTGMALQALSSYYGKRSDVTEAVNKALTWIEKNQKKSGGFAMGDTETLESTAQIVTALSSLGIDCAKDARFIKNGKWPMTGLLQYYLPQGGFMHVISQTSIDGIATEQGFYAAVAYQRFLQGKTFLYDMSDLTLQAGKAIEMKETPDTEKTNPKDDKKNENKEDKKEDKKPQKPNIKDNKGTTVKPASKPSGTTKKLGTTLQTKPSVKKTLQKQETKEKESGWTLTMEDYVPETDNEEETEAVPEETKQMLITEIKKGIPFAMAGIFGVLGLEAIIFVIYKKKGRRLR